MRYINRLMIAFVWAGMCHLGWAQEQASYFMHTIVKGQSLYSIAGMYGVSRADIIKLNPGSDERIYTGAQLRIPRVSTDIQGKHADTFHTIVKGETLYRVSVQYKVSAADICKANPGLSAENFKAGQVVRIPQSGITGQGHDSSRQDQQSSDSQAPKQDTGVQPRCRDMHKVKRRETIYGISRQYHLTEAELIAANPELKGTDKLKRGSYLCIPYPQDTNVPSHTNERIPTNIELFNESAPKPKDMSTIRAAIVLPFLNVPKSESGRMVEYYEGFLLAVDSLKRTGVSIDLHTYNSGSDAASISTLLNREELKQMDIIFGPCTNNTSSRWPNLPARTTSVW